MARTVKPTAPKPPDWVKLPDELYAKTAAELVTLSHKSSNSNIPPGGVRLAPDQGLKLPYVSARTLLGAGQVVALDYVANSGKTATAVKQLHQAAEGSNSVPAEEAQRLQQILADANRSGREIGTQAVSLRARQLLLPKGPEHYVAVTPLSAGGVCRLIRARVRIHEELRRKHPVGEANGLQRIPAAVFGLGGANPQNVGSLVRDMQRPLVFFPPTENRQIKLALALYFKGATMRLPRSLVWDLRNWYASRRALNAGNIPTLMHTRDEEIVHIREIARAVIEQGEHARQRLLNHLDVLPAGGAPLVSPKADPVARGLADPELRERDWPRAFAEKLTRQLADYRFNDGRGEFLFDQDSRNAIQAMIEEFVR